MKKILRQRILLVVALAALSAASSPAQTPAGGEFRLNSYTTGPQRAVSVAVDGVGDFVATWHGAGPGGWGVHARRFDAAGRPKGGEFTIAAGNDIGMSSVDSAASGAFVVVWEANDADYIGLRARRFGRNGAPLGADFAVNVTTTSYQFLPSVAVAPDGGFLVVWSSLGQDGSSMGVVGRRFDASGAGGAEFIVNAFTTSYQLRPRVAFAPGGGFTVAWQGDSGPVGRTDIFARRFDAAGTPQGPEFVVNTYRGDQQGLPALAIARDGGSMLVWTGAEPSGGFDTSGVFAQCYQPSGAPLGGEFRVHDNGLGGQLYGQVAVDRNGAFLVVWYKAEEPIDVSGRYFEPSGTPRGLEFRINTYTTGDQELPAVAADPSGNFVVAWSSGSYPPGSPQDGDRFGIYAQRFGGLQPAGLAADVAGNGVLEAGETAVIAPAWRNVSGATLSLNGSALSFTGPTPATYTIVDASASYGTFGDLSTASCSDTGDCYVVAVSAGNRPATHWDAVLEEAAGNQHGRSWRVHLGGSFTDVPSSSAFYRFVETVLHRGVTAGCGGALYCPAAATTREQMAAMVLGAREGAGYRPPACGTPMFADVPASSPFCPFVEELARRGVAAGCGPGVFCPASATTREQMAVFVLRTLDPALDPPACGTPMFADVPASSPFCRWIEELARRGVVAGCGGGYYCPQAAVTRDQMAVFLTATFGLTLYGP